jgi:hypothetical protein
MKQQIICEECGGKYPLQEYPGEWSKSIKGELAKAGLFCDLCGRSLQRGETVLAQSMGRDNVVYFPWEWEYLKPTPPVTLKIRSAIRPDDLVELTGRVLGRYSRGFNLTAGGWTPMRASWDPGARPAEFVLFLPKGARKVRGIPVGEIANLEEALER